MHRIVINPILFQCIPEYFHPCVIVPRALSCDFPRLMRESSRELRGLFVWWLNPASSSPYRRSPPYSPESTHRLVCDPLTTNRQICPQRRPAIAIESAHP